MAYMHYTMLELIMLCKMYMNFESPDKIPRWMKLEREIAHRGRGVGVGRSVGRGRWERGS